MEISSPNECDKILPNEQTEPTEYLANCSTEDGTRWMTELCNAVVRDGKIPEDWSRSWLVNVYKGKGDALECGSYRGKKLGRTCHEGS